MPNDEKMTNSESRRYIWHKPLNRRFVLRHSDFFRHSSFGIRHLAFVLHWPFAIDHPHQAMRTTGTRPAITPPNISVFWLSNFSPRRGPTCPPSTHPSRPLIIQQI